MHARRRFKKALDSGDGLSALPLLAFKKLYAIEREVAELTADARAKIRQEKSAPVYDELVSWCQTHGSNELPNSPLAKAMAYLLNHEQALRRFIEDD